MHAVVSAADMFAETEASSSSELSSTACGCPGVAPLAAAKFPPAASAIGAHRVAVAIGPASALAVRASCRSVADISRSLTEGLVAEHED